MLLPKNSVPFEGLNYSSGLSILLHGVVTVLRKPRRSTFKKENNVITRLITRNNEMINSLYRES